MIRYRKATLLKPGNLVFLHLRREKNYYELTREMCVFLGKVKTDKARKFFSVEDKFWSLAENRKNVWNWEKRATFQLYHFFAKQVAWADGGPNWYDEMWNSGMNKAFWFGEVYCPQHQQTEILLFSKEISRLEVLK